VQNKTVFFNRLRRKQVFSFKISHITVLQQLKFNLIISLLLYSLFIVAQQRLRFSIVATKDWQFPIVATISVCFQLLQQLSKLLIYYYSTMPICCCSFSHSQLLQQYRRCPTFAKIFAFVAKLTGKNQYGDCCNNEWRNCKAKMRFSITIFIVDLDDYNNDLRDWNSQSLLLIASPRFDF